MEGADIVAYPPGFDLPSLIARGRADGKDPLEPGPAVNYTFGGVPQPWARLIEVPPLSTTPRLPDLRAANLEPRDLI